MNPVTHTGQAGQASASPLRILLVDDSGDALEALAMLLEFEGARVTTAIGAKEAIAAVENATFDLLNAGIGMPDIDGYALAQTLRFHGNTAQIPMVALTGFGRTVDIEHAHAAGFYAHLTKPVTMRDLQPVLVRLFPR